MSSLCASALHSIALLSQPFFALPVEGDEDIDKSSEARSDEHPESSAPAERPEDVASVVENTECLPSCRRGYVCVAGACVSACNPVCPSNEVCTDSGECISRPEGDSPCAPVSTTSAADQSTKKSAPRSPHALSLAYGLELGYILARHSEVRFSPPLPSSDPALVQGHLGVLGLNGLLEYGFFERIFVGVRLGVGQILNSDFDYSASVHLSVGPAVTFFPTKWFFAGLDASVNYLTYEDVPATVSARGRKDPRVTFSDVTAKTSLGFAYALRTGFAIRASDRLSITPEFRAWGQPKTIVWKGGESYAQYRPDSSFNRIDAEAQPDRVSYLGTSLSVGVRTLF